MPNKPTPQFGKTRQADPVVVPETIPALPTDEAPEAPDAVDAPEAPAVDPIVSETADAALAGILAAARTVASGMQGSRPAASIPMRKAVPTPAGYYSHQLTNVRPAGGGKPVLGKPVGGRHYWPFSSPEALVTTLEIEVAAGRVTVVGNPPKE